MRESAKTLPKFGMVEIQGGGHKVNQNVQVFKVPKKPRDFQASQKCLFLHDCINEIDTFWSSDGQTQDLQVFPVPEKHEVFETSQKCLYQMCAKWDEMR